MERDIIATVERSAGNGEVGEMWTETAIFRPTATLSDVALWADKGRKHLRLGGAGRVTLTYAERPPAALES